MAHEIEVASASPADVAADMTAHRKMYGNFITLLQWTMGIAAIILIIVFFLLL